MEPLESRLAGAAAVMVADHDGRPLAMGAAAIDIGHALVARNELQNVSDAAALAGTRALGIIYEGMTIAAQQTYVLTGGDQATVVAAVQATANANSAAGVSITINAQTLRLGRGILRPERTLLPQTNQKPCESYQDVMLLQTVRSARSLRMWSGCRASAWVLWRLQT